MVILRYRAEINNNPRDEDIGVINVTATYIILEDNDHTTYKFFTSSLAQEFINNENCTIKQDLQWSFENAEISDDVRMETMAGLKSFINEILSSNQYSPNCTLSVWLTLEDMSNEYDDYIEFRPANRSVIENLNKKIYKKTNKSICETCAICLEEMKNGETVVILPCGHEFEENCIVTWLKINHVCPICRFELPCD